jgi:hypothetical protein
MPFISLGFACLVRQSIDRYNGFRVETNFFDWLMSNFKTVLFIMQNLDNLSSFLTHDRFTDKGITDNNPTHRYVEHNEIYFLSLHDFPVEMDFWSYVDTFIQKYTRRAERLKFMIQNCEEKINFIHYIPYGKDIPNIEEIYCFIMTIKAINSNCNFCINLFIPPELHNFEDKINELQICKNVKIYYMVSNGETITMQRTDLNWTEIYDRIEK